MQFPKLILPHSGYAVSLTASFILVVFYLSLSCPQFAYAAEADPITTKDPDRPHSLEFQDPLGFTEQYAWHEDEVRQDYEPDFAGLDRGIIGRAPSEPQNLENNTPGKRSIQGGGDTHYWVFQNKTLWGPHAPVTSGLPSSLYDGMDWGTSPSLKGQQNDRGGFRMVFISLSVCDQPSSNSSKQNGAPPPLELYISVSSSNQNPGPENNNNAVSVDGGFGSLTLNATSDIYFAVLAPASSDFSGNYSYELAVSIDAPYASYVDTEVLNLLDSDTNAALLETNVTANANTSFNSDLYQSWMTTTPPFSIFASNQNNSAVWAIRKSFCGLKNHVEITGNPADPKASSVNMSMTARAGGSPKEQFYIQNLNGTTAYYAFPAIAGKSNQSGGSVVGGGGMVWAHTWFRTKSDGNCRVLFDLPFCSEVAYAVPSNPNKTYTELKTFYDNAASSFYVNFSKSLQLIPCNTTSSAKYSLARNCTDCADAYKKWLCAVVIPRCEDFSSPSNHSWLKPRNINQTFIDGTPPSTDINPMFTSANKSIMHINSSRYPLIDATVMPGPYKEVLPCTEMCYELVRSCPASLQFACPLRGRGLEHSYGNRNPNLLPLVTCNYLGNITGLSVGVPQDRNFVLLTIACATALLMGVFV